MARTEITPKDPLNARLSGEYDGLAAKIETTKCVFCDLREKYVLTEKKGLVLTVNIFPYIDGQMLVIPRRHIETIQDVTPEEAATNLYLSQLAVRVLKEEMDIDGVWMILREGQMGKSGKTVRHLHWNVMPYRDGLNTWHYQELTITPLDLATKLRPAFIEHG